MWVSPRRNAPQCEGAFMTKPKFDTEDTHFNATSKPFVSQDVFSALPNVPNFKSS
jgi:hypothetical protein